MTGARLWAVLNRAEALLLESGTARIAAAGTAGLVLTGFVLHMASPAPSGDASRADTAAPVQVAASKSLPPADCSEATWPYLDQRCSSNDTAPGSRAVRVIALDKSAPAAVRSAPAPVVAKAAPPAAQQSRAPAGDSPELFGANSGSGVDPALAVAQTIASPPQAIASAPPPADNPPATPAAASPQAATTGAAPAEAAPPPPPSTTAARAETENARPGHEKPRARAAQRQRPVREAVRMDGRGEAPGTVIEEKTYRMPDGRTLTMRKIYRGDGGPVAQRGNDDDDNNAAAASDDEGNQRVIYRRAVPPEFTRVY
jgi:hypothetical protein